MLEQVAPPILAVADDRMTTSSGREPTTQESVLEALCSAVGNRLGITPMAIDHKIPTSTFGIDSLAAIEIAHAVERRCKVSLSYEMLLSGLSLQRISEIIASQIPATLPTISSLMANHGNLPRHRELSFGQEALWNLYKQAPSSSAYNIAVALRVLSPLDYPRLQRCLGILAHRHSLLRARFNEFDGRVAHTIEADGNIVLHVEEDCTGDSQSLKDQITEEIERPFDLRNGPPLRVSLWGTRDSARTMLFVVHHIVADLWSLSILVSELFTLYASDEGFALPEVMNEYSDYVTWQRGMLESSQGDRHWSYWRSQIKPDSPRLDLPTDFPRYEARTCRGGCAVEVFDDGLTSSLKIFSTTHGLTLSMTVLAILQVLFYRYTQQSDLIIGCALAGRSQPEWAGLFGYFVNSMPIVAHLSKRLSFIEFAQQTRASMIGALDHMDYPLSTLVERLNPTRVYGRQPLFDCLFVYEQTPRGDLAGLAAFALGIGGKRMKIGPVEIESVSIERRDTTFDLTIMAGDLGDEIGITAKFNADLFEQSTVHRLLRHFSNLARSVVADPLQEIQRLPLLTDVEECIFLPKKEPGNAERNRILPQARCISDLFERQARMRPNTDALRFEGQVLTYGELQNRATTVVAHLQRFGVGTETPVALFLERGIDMIAAMLGVLKAGAIYVPLDPNEPAARLASMLRTVRPQVILTRNAYRDHLSIAFPSEAVVDIDSCVVDRDTELKDIPKSDRSGAYIIFTSGSTGEPKGVCVERRQLLNYVEQICKRIQPEPGDGYALVSTPTADLGNTMIFPALCTGGCLHILSSERAVSPSGFAEYCRSHRVDFLKIVPSHLDTLLGRSPLPGALPRRCVILGGESCSAGLIQKIHHSSADCKILNHYGPTETTIGVLTHEIDPLNARSNGSSIPLGLPLDNIQAYILDTELQPVPIGVLGDLYIGGKAVSRGYYNRPAETAEAFIPDRFSNEPGSRMYRTGDIARYRADGMIEFHGRKDSQVKLRGYRIEPAEIEVALSRHPAVVQAVAVLTDIGGAGRQLAAFVVTQEPNEVEASELRRFLRDHLPEHMIPGSMTCLNSLPLTPNGKLDRAALLEQALHPIARKGIAEPSKPIERALVSMWQRLIGTQNIGVDDDFFELGGHSLMATQMTSRLEDIFPSNTPLLVPFLQTPTVAGLASAILRDHPDTSHLDEAIELIQRSEFTFETYLGRDVRP